MKRRHFGDNIIELGNSVSYRMLGKSRIIDNSKLSDFNNGEDSSFIFWIREAWERIWAIQNLICVLDIKYEI